jgi:hypothetical protein
MNQNDIFELYRARGFQKYIPQVCGIAKKKVTLFWSNRFGTYGLRAHSMAIWGCIMHTKFVVSTYYSFKVGF